MTESLLTLGAEDCDRAGAGPARAGLRLQHEDQLHDALRLDLSRLHAHPADRGGDVVFRPPGGDSIFIDCRAKLLNPALNPFIGQLKA